MIKKPMRVNTFVLSILLLGISLVIFIAFIPIYCNLQLRATNTSPFSSEGKITIFYGAVSYVLIHDYRIFMAIIISFPYRLQIFKKNYSESCAKSLFLRDLKYVVFPTLTYSGVIITMYWYIISNYRGINDDLQNYVYFSSYSSILLEILLAFMIVYSIPATMFCFRKAKRNIFTGLPASMISSIITILITVPLSYMQIILWRCSATDLGIEVVNPNTSMIEITASIDLAGLIGNIIWYLLYSYFIYYFGKKTIMK